jgi:TolA-binding protein
MAEHAKRVRIRRKDLREPDEFETLTGRAVELAAAYRTPLAVGLAVVVAAGLVALGISSWRASERAAAAQAFQRTHEVFAVGRFAEAAQGFASVVEEHGGTPAGRLAQLYRAHALARQDDAAGAAAAYQEFLASGPPGPLLEQDALLNLGRAREVTGDAAGARQAYEQAAGLAGPYTREALLGMARLDEAAGRTEAAREVYARVLKDATEPDLRAFLSSKLPPASAAPTAPADAAPRAE